LASQVGLCNMDSMCVCVYVYIYIYIYIYIYDDLKERRGYSRLKEEALDRTMWRARFVRGFGPVVRQITK
jgi:hypothetical protein